MAGVKRSRGKASSPTAAAKRKKVAPKPALQRASTLAAVVAKAEPTLRPVSRTMKQKGSAEKARVKKSSIKKASTKKKTDSSTPMKMSTGEENLDAEQLRLLAEQVILVDMKDNPVGFASKRESHIVANIEAGMLHRAFSVFLFNKKNELLLQQRASEKITFPDMWTNTCCSHPLNIKGETDEEDGIGAKRAAVRKLDHELGIKVGSIKPEEFKFMTKIHYKALQDENWGEHEVDHLFLLKKDKVSFKLNPNEVRATRWVSMSQLKQLFEDRDAGKKDELGEVIKITPWFEMICHKFLFKWWENLDESLSDKVKPTPPRKVWPLKL